MIHTANNNVTISKQSDADVFNGVPVASFTMLSEKKRMRDADKLL